MRSGIIRRVPPRSHMTGMSLLELMIAMTLGLLITAAVGYVYVGSLHSSRGADALSRVQEFIVG